MVDLHGYYYEGKKNGIWKWNGGEGSRLESECKSARRGGGTAEGKALVARVLNAGRAEWGGIKYIEFFEHGKLTTPWGSGSWGDASSAKRPNTIYADFIGQVHMLTFSGDDFSFMRCSDGEKGSGRLA